MSSTVFVVDSSFKRTQIKVTPGRNLREILEEACRARKWNPEEYTLKTQSNKAIDLSQPFRLSGLSAGAKLQLVQASRSPSVVSVAIQLPESEGGGRLSDKFPSTTSLWLVLRKFEDGVAGSAKKLNLTQRGAPSQGAGAGRLLYEQPCVNLMGRSLETFADLQKTLAQLGLNGSALVRLTFRTTEQPLEEAMQEISQYFTSVDSIPAGVGSAASPNAPVDTPVAIESTAEPASADDTAQTLPDAPPAETPSDVPLADTLSETPTTTSEPIEPSPPTNTINGISVYRPPSSSTPAAALAPDDPAVFEPNIDHAKAHQAALQRASRNTRLLSDKELDEQAAERQQKLSTVQSVVVRVRYPDQSMIETTIYASETTADLYAKVTDTLAAASEPFELRFLGAKGQQTLPNSASQRLVRDFGFRGKVLVTLAWAPEASVQARTGPSLKEEYRSRATELKVDLASQQAAGQAAHQTALQKPDSGVKDGGGSKGRGDVEAKMKKFLGFGKK